MSDRLAVDRTAGDLASIYRQAQRALIDQIKAALAGDRPITAMQRRLQLAAVVAYLDQVGAETDPIARRLAREAFDEGAQRAARQIAGAGITGPGAASFAAVSREAVAALEESIVAALRGTRYNVGRQVNDVFAKAQQRAALRAMLGAEGSARSAAAQLRDDLLRHGITGFVDRAGRRWKLADYTDMAVRTVTREAAVQGAVARMASHGINLARVSTHAGSCSVCLPFEGKLVSLDGSVSEYEGEGTISDMPPFHPRCGHSLQPFVTSIESIRRELAGTA